MIGFRGPTAGKIGHVIALFLQFIEVEIAVYEAAKNRLIIISNLGHNNTRAVLFEVRVDIEFGALRIRLRKRIGAVALNSGPVDLAGPFDLGCTFVIGAHLCEPHNKRAVVIRLQDMIERAVNVLEIRVVDLLFPSS